MQRRAKKTVYRYSLLTLLAVTEMVSRADYQVPSKWHSVIDSFRSTSLVIHGALSTLDEDVEQEYREKERMIEKRLGKQKFYDEKEVERLKNNYTKMEV